MTDEQNNAEANAQSSRDEQMRGQSILIKAVGEKVHALANALAASDGKVALLEQKVGDLEARMEELRDEVLA